MSIHVSLTLYAECPLVQAAGDGFPEIISRFGQHLVVEAMGRTVAGCRLVTVNDYSPATEAAMRATAEAMPKVVPPPMLPRSFKRSRSWSRR